MKAEIEFPQNGNLEIISPLYKQMLGHWGLLAEQLPFMCESLTLQKESTDRHYMIKIISYNLI